MIENMSDEELFLVPGRGEEADSFNRALPVVVMDCWSPLL